MSKFEDEIVAQVNADFKKRQEQRRAVELNWRLNMNFVLGNQFAEISPKGDIADSEREYFWQQREVYNHIAPILETRLAKLARVKARPIVRPATKTNMPRAPRSFSLISTSRRSARTFRSTSVSSVTSRTRSPASQRRSRARSVPTGWQESKL